MRLVFAGTPEVALPALRALTASRHTVAAVVTRPDAPAGRGRRMVASPVAALAEELGIEALKPVRPSEPSFLTSLRALAPDCCPVVAYGALIPQAALDIPRHGWVNLHFSVLPAWRGAAPVQHAVLRGDDITGATTFQLVKELDAGPVYGTLTEPIRPADTSGDLLDRLADLRRGAPRRDSGRDRGRHRPRRPAADRRHQLRPQAHPRRRPRRLEAPRAPDRPPDPRLHPRARRLDRLRIHAPQALARHPDRVGRPRCLGRPGSASAAPAQAPGELRVERGAVYVGTGSITVRLGDVQPQGKRRMPAADWARGLRADSAVGLGLG